jgi:hypothetical protein
MTSRRNKIILNLVIVIINSIFLGFVFANIIGANACRGNPDPNCQPIFFIQWFFPTFGLSFLVLAACVGLALLKQKID